MKKLLLMSAALGLMLVVAACGGGGGGSGDTVTRDSALVGTWVLSTYDGDAVGNTDNTIT